MISIALTRIIIGCLKMMGMAFGRVEYKPSRGCFLLEMSRNGCVVSVVREANFSLACSGSRESELRWHVSLRDLHRRQAHSHRLGMALLVFFITGIVWRDPIAKQRHSHLY